MVKRFLLFLCLFLICLSIALNAYAITRDAVISRAADYTNEQWYSSGSNANSTWNEFEADKWYSGVSYNWGGLDTLEQFRTKIKSGAVAGNSKSTCDDASCVHKNFAGVDCTGLMMKVWRTPGWYNTKKLIEIATPISSWGDLRRGDILHVYIKDVRRHVRLFFTVANDGDITNNQILVFESTTKDIPFGPPRVIHSVRSKLQMKTQGYAPYKYNNIEEDEEIVDPAVAAGSYHSLALKYDGTVWAWGDNGLGQLGDGTFTQRNSFVPVGISDVKAIAAGHTHSLALKSDGTVWAWGNNHYGQLGDGTNERLFHFS